MLDKRLDQIQEIFKTDTALDPAQLADYFKTLTDE